MDYKHVGLTGGRLVMWEIL